ncbi:polyprenyl synthetase family protein [bacterium]|jgi:geranylgeranyl pyrophosphate synthase|nr:polyprenyl synthetase family protein [bacterium]MBT4292083.1 polyprenyl synthetase family protein [bacterium]
MCKSAIKDTFANEVIDFENYLRATFDSFKGIPNRLKSAMGHSLFSGGKRLRPILALWTFESLADSSLPEDRERILSVGVALEMIHTYSLIHDDLPAMDDDDLRRSRPTCHIEFDEATAILAGDGLQALAFEILSDIPAHGAALVNDLAISAGPAGMVGGQQLDLDNEGQDLSDSLIKEIHSLKTANLIAVSIAMGARLAGLNSDKLDAVKSAGMLLGLAFQAADDILDVTSDSITLGKTAGKDMQSEKPTWVRYEGLAMAEKRMMQYGSSGQQQLASLLPINDSSSKLLELVENLWERDR